MNQQEHDLRSLAWHTHVVERMREDPELMQKALAIGTRWLALGPRRSDVYTRAWVELLRHSHAPVVSRGVRIGPRRTERILGSVVPKGATRASDAFVWPVFP